MASEGEGDGGTAGALRSARDRATSAVAAAAEVTRDKAREAVENVKEAAGAAKRRASEAVRRGRDALAADADADELRSPDEAAGPNTGKEGKNAEGAEVSAFPETLDDAIASSRPAGDNPGDGGKEGCSKEGGPLKEAGEGDGGGQGPGAVEPSPFVADAGARSKL
jgi:hypothetical protein